MNKLKPVPESFSIYLDALRLFAALYVVLFHLKKLQVGSIGLLKLIPDHGHDAVVLFFVLSGYVISASVDRHASKDWRDYLLDRASRVYSVALPTLLFSGAVFIFLNLYNGKQWSTELTYLFSSSVLNAVFLGQSWSTPSWVAYNQPYWSLCYEVMYYALFGIFVFGRNHWRWVGLMAVAVVAGPKVLLLMPCWLVGVAVYKWRDQIFLTQGKAIAFGFLMPVVILILLNKIGFGPFVRDFLDNSLENRADTLYFSEDFLIDYVTACLVAINLYAARFINFPKILSIVKVVRAGANMSFTLYLMHMPMIFLVVNIIGERRHTNFWFICSLLFILGACYVISTVTEHRRKAFRQYISKMIVRS